MLMQCSAQENPDPGFDADGLKQTPASSSPEGHPWLVSSTAVYSLATRPRQRPPDRANSIHTISTICNMIPHLGPVVNGI